MAGSPQWSCDIHTTLPLQIGTEGYAAAPPITVGELFRKTRDAFPDNVALSWKDGDEWKRMTYVEYYNECVRAAKSFIKVSYLSVCLYVCMYVCLVELIFFLITDMHAVIYLYNCYYLHDLLVHAPCHAHHLKEFSFSCARMIESEVLS